MYIEIESRKKSANQSSNSQPIPPSTFGTKQEIPQEKLPEKRKKHITKDGKRSPVK